MATHKERFLAQANTWIGAKESGGQNHYKKGTKLAEIFNTYGASQGTAWCAVFVSSCGIKAGAKSIIGKSSWAAGICHKVVKNGGTWIPGPYKTKTKVKPQPGDLILYNSKSSHVTYNSDGTVKSWHGSHVGIVYKVTSSQIISIEGNLKGGKCDTVKHSFGAKSIGGYARPAWSKIDTGSGGSGSGSGSGGGYAGPLYSTSNDRHDMTMREIGYMTSDGKLTTKASTVQLSLINYTSVLGDLWKMFGSSTYGGLQFDTSKLKGNCKITMDYLIKQGMGVSAACGVAANIQTDSNYNPALAKDNCFGICKWTGVDAGKMRMFIGEFEWATSLSGQLDYLMSDLETTYASLYESLKKVSNTPEGAKKAAKLFAESYRKITSNSTRQTVAQSLYSQIIATAPKQTGTTTPKKTCTVLKVSQTGQKALSVSYKTYGEIGTCDTTIYNEWVKKGKSTNKGLATISGYYLVAYNVNSLSCKVNDLITLDLNGGSSISCLVAGGHNDSTTPIIFYRPKNSILNLKDWAVATIKQIRNFGQRK